MKTLLLLLFIQGNPYIGTWRIIKVEQNLVENNTTVATNVVYPKNTTYTFDEGILSVRAEGIMVMCEKYKAESNSIYFEKSHLVWLNIRQRNDTLHCEYNEYSDNGVQMFNNKATLVRE